jgi:hypothetical protein
MSETLKRGHDETTKPKHFLKKTEAKFRRRARICSRWNFICPLQPHAANNMPDAVDTCDAFNNHFNPERIRVVLLNPTRDSTILPQAEVQDLISRFRRLGPKFEALCIDARDRTANGLFYADFFDFT